MSKRRFGGIALASFLISILFAISAYAQSGSSTVQGTVKDPQGNLVSGATVTLTDPAKNFTRTQQTNADGAYILTAIPPGTYKLEVTAPGFKTASASGLVALVDTPTVRGPAPVTFSEIQPSGAASAALTAIRCHSAGISPSRWRARAAASDAPRPTAPMNAARAAVLTPRCAATDAPAIPPIEAAKAADDVADTLATLARSWTGHWPRAGQDVPPPWQRVAAYRGSASRAPSIKSVNHAAFRAPVIPRGAAPSCAWAIGGPVGRTISISAVRNLTQAGVLVKGRRCRPSRPRLGRRRGRPHRPDRG